jgi:hypothetical protein
MSLERPRIAEVMHLAVPAADAVNKIDIFMDRHVVGYVTEFMLIATSLHCERLSTMTKCVCPLMLPDGKVSDHTGHIRGTITDLADQIMRVCELCLVDAHLCLTLYTASDGAAEDWTRRTMCYVSPGVLPYGRSASTPCATHQLDIVPVSSWLSSEEVPAPEDESLATASASMDGTGMTFELWIIWSREPSLLCVCAHAYELVHGDYLEPHTEIRAQASPRYIPFPNIM